MAVKTFAQGELLVTGTGHVVIDEALPRSRALLVQPREYVLVEFDPNEPPPPPCAGGPPDDLDWELFFHHAHEHHDYHHAGPEEDLRLRISWHVNEARTIIWQIKIPC